MSLSVLAKTDGRYVVKKESCEMEYRDSNEAYEAIILMARVLDKKRPVNGDVEYVVGPGHSMPQLVPSGG